MAALADLSVENDITSRASCIVVMAKLNCAVTMRVTMRMALIVTLVMTVPLSF